MYLIFFMQRVNISLHRYMFTIEMYKVYSKKYTFLLSSKNTTSVVCNRVRKSLERQKLNKAHFMEIFIVA